MFVDIEKIIQVICYFLQKFPQKQLDYTKILKLVFFADKYHLREYWDMITNDKYYAMKLWPVASLTYDILKNPEDLDLEWIDLPFEKDNFLIILKKEISDFDFLSETEKDTLDKIYKTFWNKDWKTLADDTHNYSERAEKYNPERWRVDMDTIDFFNNSVNQDKIFDESPENLEITKSLYVEKLNYAI